MVNGDLTRIVVDNALVLRPNDRLADGLSRFEPLQAPLIDEGLASYLQGAE